MALELEIVELKKELDEKKRRICTLEDDNSTLKESENELRLFCTQKVGEMSGQLKSASSIIKMASMQHPGMVPPFDYVESPLPIELGFQGAKKRKRFGDDGGEPRQLLNDSSSTISALD